mgnify:CR=1 FL=1
MIYFTGFWNKITGEVIGTGNIIKIAPINQKLFPCPNYGPGLRIEWNSINGINNYLIEYKEENGEWKYYTWENKNKTLLSRIDGSLIGIKDAIGEDYDLVYLTRIDSDDMLHCDAVELIQAQEPGYKKALIFEKGYIYNVLTGELADWNPPTNPPFHTIIFPGNIFFNPQLHCEYYGTFKTHEAIPKVFDATTLDIHRFCVSYHGKQINTAWKPDLLQKTYHKLKYGPKGYCYTTSGKNISTHWKSQSGKLNFMIGEDRTAQKDEILRDFGVWPV